MKPGIRVWERALSKILQPPTIITHLHPPHPYCPKLNLFLGGEQMLSFPIWRTPPLPKTPAGESWLSVSHALSSSSDIHGDFNGSIKQNASINIRKFCWLGATFKVTLISTAPSIFHPTDGRIGHVWTTFPRVHWVFVETVGQMCGGQHASLGAQRGLNLTGRRRDHRLSFRSLGKRCLIRTGVSFRSFPLLCHYLLLPVKNKFCLKVIFGR